MYFLSTYCKVASTTSPSQFEAHAGLFRLSMKGILDDYVLLPFGKNFIFELVARVETPNSTVLLSGSHYYSLVLSLIAMENGFQLNLYPPNIPGGQLKW